MFRMQRAAREMQRESAQMTRPQRWHATVSGEQVITLTFTVAWEAEGDCDVDPGRTYGDPGDCWEPSSEVDVTECKCVILDEKGFPVNEDGELGRAIMAQFSDEAVRDALLETSPADFREDRRDYERED